MPTVLRLNGRRVVIYGNEHPPVHVHVIHGGCEAVFELNCREESVALRENYRFSRTAIRRIAKGLGG